jgi:hypothetical protein
MKSPNQALERTAPRVTPDAPPPSSTQPSRRAGQSLSLGSLGVARVMSKLATTFLLMCSSVLLSCGGQPDAAQQKRDTDQLPKCFGVLQQLRVGAYRNQDWCKNIVYQRGKFSKNSESACNLFQGTPLPFDAQAQKDFDAVAAAIRSTGVSLNFIGDLTYSGDGKLVGAEFHLAGGPNRYSYVYSPGYNSLPSDQPKELEYTRISKDWYYVWEDWN